MCNYRYRPKSNLLPLRSRFFALYAQQQRARADEKEDYFIKTRIKCNLPRAPWRISERVRILGNPVHHHFSLSALLGRLFYNSYIHHRAQAHLLCVRPVVNYRALTMRWRAQQKRNWCMCAARSINGPPLNSECVCVDCIVIILLCAPCQRLNGVRFVGVARAIIVSISLTEVDTFWHLVNWRSRSRPIVRFALCYSMRHCSPWEKMRITVMIGCSKSDAKCMGAHQKD